MFETVEEDELKTSEKGTLHRTTSGQCKPGQGGVRVVFTAPSGGLVPLFTQASEKRSQEGVIRIGVNLVQVDHPSKVERGRS
jgi:hypothetical protein